MNAKKQYDQTYVSHYLSSMVQCQKIFCNFVTIMIVFILVIIMGLIVLTTFGTMMVIALREKTDPDERVNENRKK